MNELSGKRRERKGKKRGKGGGMLGRGNGGWEAVQPTIHREWAGAYRAPQFSDLILQKKYC